MARDEKVILGYTVRRYRGEPHYHDHIAIFDPVGEKMAMGGAHNSDITEWPAGMSDRELMYVIQGIKVGRWIAAEQMSDAFLNAAMHAVSNVRIGNQHNDLLEHHRREAVRENEIRQEAHLRHLRSLGFNVPMEDEETDCGQQP